MTAQTTSCGSPRSFLAWWSAEEIRGQFGNGHQLAGMGLLAFQLNTLAEVTATNFLHQTRSADFPSEDQVIVAVEPDSDEPGQTLQTLAFSVEPGTFYAVAASILALHRRSLLCAPLTGRCWVSGRIWTPASRGAASSTRLSGPRPSPWTVHGAASRQARKRA
ncbi:hypothetical protein SAMN00790413_06707 [Deinococcus hopiensis KR-140]|uniref:Uncharacterized protein n=1 Tax=Deinococcus hopiensis KR-140 TaxID=695939 RepID=A0A1W1UBW9_9DEIO|nr:hypothetical protein SAMN00790413_06707 [Deinococcus hopiensis KR-140]